MTTIRRAVTMPRGQPAPRASRVAGGRPFQATQLPRRGCACGGGCPRCLAGSGQALPAALATPLARHLGADLSGVRLHTGAEAARAVAAAGARRAFASGEHIVVGDPAFAPTSAAGRRLLAHEAAHVVQQRGGTPMARVDPVPLEAEAQRSAHAFGAGLSNAPIRSGSAPAGALQRDDPAPGAPAGPGLQLDPDLQARWVLAQWLAQQGGAGGGAADPADPADTAAALPPRWLGTPRLGAETLDFGSLVTPYYDRGLMPAGHGDTRDLEMVNRLFGERYRLVLGLPDLRAAAPAFVRPLIPGNWRVQLAATLTSTSIDLALSRDNPTFFELSNQTWERFTGATTISFPMLPVPVVNDWWNRFSGGGR